MTGCPHPTQRSSGYCRMCSIERQFDDIDLDDLAEYECPECGGDTSGHDVVCYRCRGDSE